MAKLTFNYSCVNAGKSARLLVQAKNLQDRGHSVKLYIPRSLDECKISSRLGIEQPALWVNPETDFVKDALEARFESATGAFPHTIFVDEAQFLSRNHVLQLTRVVDDLDINVEAFGLRTDYTGEPFVGSKYLLSWADELVEVKTACSSGGYARFSRRLGSSSNQIEIGQHYEPVSRKVFELWRR